MAEKRKTVVCVFAHPDDEAFGPGGTIAILAKTHDVYILYATRGEAGTLHKHHFLENVSRTRTKELEASCHILGTHGIIFLGFKDGTLNNNMYHTLAAKIESYVTTLKPEVLITFEHRGISGHLDHIAVSMATTYVFNKLTWIKEIWYYCLSQEQRSRVDDYYIYFPPGYSHSEINKTVDIKQVWELKLESMGAHSSQRNDIQRTLKVYEELPQEEYFIISKRN